MTDTPRSRIDLPLQPKPPAYRAIIIAKGGTVINALRLPAEDDEEASERARAMVDGHAVELWDGLRFIESFAPVD